MFICSMVKFCLSEINFMSKKNKRSVSSENHKTTLMQFKPFEIDTKMVPVVEWLNSYVGITTEYCCENDGGYFYILFRCDDMLSLSDISRHVEDIVIVSPNNAVSYMRFLIRQKIKQRDKFVEFIVKKFSNVNSNIEQCVRAK